MFLNHCRLYAAFTGGFASEDGCVEIKDGKIASVSSARPDTDSDCFDCAGKTLLPGLIDLHTHITMLGNVGVSSAGDPMQLVVEAAEQAKRYLHYGFTTIRDCGSIGRSANYVKKLIAKDVIAGPDILACGNVLMPGIIDRADPLGGINNYCDGAEAYRKGVRSEVAKRSDFIKIYASGSAFMPTGVPTHPIMTFDEIRTAVETAQANGLYVAAHCHADSAILDCIHAGVRTIEHATYITPKTTDVLLSTPDAFLVPTFAAMYVSQTEPNERAFWLERLTPMLESCAQTIEYAYRAGATIGFGTDSAPLSKQYEHGVEFRYRKEYCHMENLDIILQATKINARIAGLSDTVGEIKPGLKGDLILVDGNPAEDLSAMYVPPARVWKNGNLCF